MRGNKSKPSRFDQLADDIKAAKLTKHEVEGILYDLSPSQRRLFLRLAAGGTWDTIAIRRELSIGNVSECARRLSEKLEAANDTRRVLCETVVHRNQFNERGIIGRWSLVDLDVTAA